MYAESGAEVSDDLLLTAVAGRDQASFNELHERLSGLVYSTALRVLNDPDDAREVAQDVFAHLWEKADLFRQAKGKASTWVFAMTRNRAIDRLRSNRRRYRLRDDFEMESAVRSEARPQPTACSIVSRQDDFRWILRRLDGLTPDQREAVDLVYLQDFTLREAADRLGVPVGTLKARVRRGLAAVRESLAANAA